MGKTILLPLVLAAADGFKFKFKIKWEMRRVDYIEAALFTETLQPAAGSVKKKAAPSPSLDSTQMRPP